MANILRVRANACSHSATTVALITETTINKGIEAISESVRANTGNKYIVAQRLLQNLKR